MLYRCTRKRKTCYRSWETELKSLSDMPKGAGMFPSEPPWKKRVDYSEDPLVVVGPGALIYAAAHENEPRLSVPSCHGRR